MQKKISKSVYYGDRKPFNRSNEMLIFDAEIVAAIPPRDGEREPGITYCNGWEDFANMGISVVCTYDYGRDAYGVYCDDNKQELKELINLHNVIVGFNSVRFDNVLLAACWGISIARDKSFDILREVWKANDLNPDVFSPKLHGGRSLDAMAAKNGLSAKTGNGALAPVRWQQGKRGDVINYCMNDVYLTRRLMDKVIRHGKLIDSKTGATLHVSLFNTQPTPAATKEVTQASLF